MVNNQLSKKKENNILKLHLRIEIKSIELQFNGFK